MHIFLHTPYQCLVINSRYVQNYMEEGLVGRVTKIWKKSMAGPYESTIQKQTLIKLLVGYVLRFGL